MKRILIVILLLLVASPLIAADRVLLVDVYEATTTGTNAGKTYDTTLRMGAALQHILYKRGAIAETYSWASGNKDTLKAKLTSGRYRFCVIYGGASTLANSTAGGADIRLFWGCDSTYCTTPTLSWFAMDARAGTSGNAYVSGAEDGGTSDRLQVLSPADTVCVVANSSAVLDSFNLEWGTSNLSLFGTKEDTTITTMTVTPIITKVNSTATFMIFWSTTFGTHTKYYLSAHDGTSAALVDALLCKYCPNSNPIEYCLTIDDYGMVRQAHAEDGAFYPWPNYTVGLRYGTPFFTELGSFFDMVRSYNSKLTICTAMRGLRNTATADSTRWQDWVSLYQSHIEPYYGTNFEMVWHDHAENNPSDSVSLTFFQPSCYNDWQAARSRTTVYLSDIDSLYSAWQDSMRSYGMRFNHAIIPPTDQYQGYYRSVPNEYPYGNLADTLLALCASYDMPMRIRYDPENSTNQTRYRSNQKRNGAKLILESYLVGVDSTKTTIGERGGDYKFNFGKLFYFASQDTTNNGMAYFYRQGIGVTSRALSSFQFNGSTIPVVVLHTGNLYPCSGGHKEQYMGTELLLKHLAFFNEFAGREIWKPVFLDEFDWNLLMETN